MNTEKFLAELTACTNVGFTPIELNNMVYLGLKYVCKDVAPQDSEYPRNDTIAKIVEQIGSNHSVDNIVDITLRSAMKMSGLTYGEFDFNNRRGMMLKTINDFCKMDPEVRNSLGDDAESLDIDTGVNS